MEAARGASSPVLVADGDVRSLRFVSQTLERAGIPVLRVADAPGAIDNESRTHPYVVLIDDQLPGAIDTVRAMREASPVPIIFTVLGDNGSAAVALHAGADALLAKPYSAELLIAQVFALVRRYRIERMQLRGQTYILGALLIDLERRIVSIEGAHVHLSIREYQLLEVLAVNCGRILTHDQLLSLVWGPGYEGNSDLLRCYIRKLRKRMDDDARDPRFIQTEKQIGYWLQRSEAD